MSKDLLYLVRKDASPDTPAKADEQVVLGVVYMPNIVDTQGDFMTAEEIQKAAYAFTKKGDMGAIDIYHNNKRINAAIVESFISHKSDTRFPVAGSWVVGVHIDDADIWEKIKKGELNGFSMEALVRVRESTDDTLKCINKGTGRVVGVTKTADGHEHSYEIVYGPDGKLANGKTSAAKDANGVLHFHTISGGMVTDAIQDHRHRFSTVEHILGS